MIITEKEKALLTKIANSEYQDCDTNSEGIIDNPVWLDYLVKSKADGGVLTSLQSKGLVSVVIVAKADSDNRFNGISDSTVAITAAGFAALNGATPYSMDDQLETIRTRKVTLLLDAAQVVKEAIERVQLTRKSPLKKWELKALEVCNKALNEPSR